MENLNIILTIVYGVFLVWAINFGLKTPMEEEIKKELKQKNN